MSDEGQGPRKTVTIPTKVRRRKLLTKTASPYERIPTFPVQTPGRIIPAKSHRPEVAKKVAPRKHAPPPAQSQGAGPSRNDFRLSGNSFPSDKPWITPRKGASSHINSRGFPSSANNVNRRSLLSGKQVQHKAITGHGFSASPLIIRKTSQAKPSQRITPGGAPSSTSRLHLRKVDLTLSGGGPRSHGAVYQTARKTLDYPIGPSTTHSGSNNNIGASSVVHSYLSRYPPTRKVVDKPALPSSSRRNNGDGTSSARSTLRQVHRKTASVRTNIPNNLAGTSGHVDDAHPRLQGFRKSPTIGLFPVDDDANVIYFEPDDRITPHNKRKLMPMPHPTKKLGFKAARKTAAPGTYYSISDDIDDDIIEINSDDTSQSEWTESSDDTDQLDPEEYGPSDPSTSTTPPKEVLEAFNELTLYTRRMQENDRLPFLQRNLRRGFLLRCQQEGKYIGPKDDNEFSLEVIYRLDDELLQYTVKGRGLFCPLCNLLGRFPTREMLAAHLEWDHTMVHVHWMDMTSYWRIIITLLPQVSDANIEELEGLSIEDIPLEYIDYDPEEHTEAPSGTINQQPSVSAEAKASVIVAPLVEMAPPSPVAPKAPSVVHPLNEAPISVPYVNVSSIPLTQPPPTPPLVEPLAASPPTPSHSAHRPSSLPPPSPPPSSPTTNLSNPAATHPDASTSPHEIQSEPSLLTTPSLLEIPSIPRTQPPQVLRPPSSRPPNLPARCPTPPPKDNPLGPAARYPYLPYESEYGGPTMFYSCRPGGPRLYDLLGTLPMEPFGLMAWYILDIEEDMFDEDHITDELKVVLALWGRWIFIHRMEFLVNYREGVIMFVDKYWRMIHHAAGWDALRWHLLILKASKFLTFHDIARVLKHYEYLVGMEYWEQ